MQLTPPIPLPDPIPLPGPLPLFQGGLLMTFVFHVLAMNMVLGGTPILVVTEGIGYWTGRSRYQCLAKTLSTVLPTAMAFAVVLGVGPLLFLQALYGQFFYTATILIGDLWIALVLAVMVAYAGLYAYKYWRDWLLLSSPWALLAIGGASMGLLWGVAFVFVTMSVLAIQPHAWQAVWREGMDAVFTLPMVLPRYLHLVCASLAGMGLLLVVYGFGMTRAGIRSTRRDDPAYGDWVIRQGVAWTLVGTLPQVVVGPWFLFSLPPHVRAALVNGESWVSLLFFASLTLALVSLVSFNAALMVPRARWLVLAGMGSLSVTMGLMIWIRDQVRHLALAEYLETPQAVPQWDMIGLFAGVAVVMVGLVGYCLHQWVTFSKMATEKSPQIH
ncbi:MAG: hypothetical protein D6704_09140 [Nitrospirae bacterium]|nr:MAG: hypothetical protein D6704_09140 [Nitrospirota bacterium]